MDLITWLRQVTAGYGLSPVGILHRATHEQWPLVAANAIDLEQKLKDAGQLSPLPKEPAALANLVEVVLVDFLIESAKSTDVVEITRGTERGYPDIDVGRAFGGGPYAIDIKVARRARNLRTTKSRISLATGNTYFRYPQLKWPGTFRPYQDYEKHIDLLAIYTFDAGSYDRVRDLEVIVHETWRIASTQRSSTTREYIGAVTAIDALREGRGEFASQDEFLRFWRKYPFKIGRAVQQQLDRLLAQREGDTAQR